MKHLTVGPCPICNTHIWKMKRLPIVQFSRAGLSINLFKVPYEFNEKGRHFWVLLTNGSRMAVAICKECFKALNDEQVKDIVADNVYTKLYNIERMNRATFDYVRTQEMFMWFGEESEVVEYLKECQNGQKHSS